MDPSGNPWAPRPKETKVQGKPRRWLPVSMITEVSLDSLGFLAYRVWGLGF